MEMISVIIPAYNAGKTIKKSLESIIGGGYSNFEIIVINDGSTDDTESIVKSIAKKEPRVILYSQENQGVAAARNAGLRLAQGEYIAWCDSDDWVEHGWLLNLYKNLKQYNADISVCRCRIGDSIIDYNQEVTEVWNKTEAISKFLGHKELNGSHVNKLFKKELFDDIVFDSTLTNYEDDSVLWEILKKVDCVVRSYRADYHYNLTPDSLTRKPIDAKRVEAVKVFEKIYNECSEKYKKDAASLLARMCFGTLLIMYKDNYSDKVIEKRMSQIMRKYARVTVKNVSGAAHKVFYLITCVSSRIARFLYNLKNLKS